MQGLMQRHPLLLSSIIAHALRHHPKGEVVSVLEDGSLHRTTYAAIEPHTATGKLNKRALRARWQDHLLLDRAEAPIPT